jgi:hypothetical protein
MTETDPATLRLVHAELKDRASRLDASTSRLDTKATTLLGFVLAAGTFLATQETGGWWKVPSFIAFAVAAYFGIQAMRVRVFKDAPEPAPLVEHVAAKSEAVALALLIKATHDAITESRKTHQKKADAWKRSLATLIIAVVLTAIAAIFGGLDGGRNEQRPGQRQPAPSAAPSADGRSDRPTPNRNGIEGSRADRPGEAPGRR